MNLEIYNLMADAPVYQGFIGALIGGAVSLIGGLSARKDAKKRDKAAAEAAKVPVETTTSHKVDAVAMVQEAERAGFNPATFLAAGGLAGFTETYSSTTGQNAMAAVPTAPSVGTVMAGAAQTTFDLWNQERQITAARAHETSLVDRQLSATTQRVSSVSAYSRTPSLGRTGTKVAGALTVGTIGLGQPTVPVIGDVTVTNPHHRQGVDPSLRNAEDMETRYGDILQEIFGVRNLVGDKVYDITGVTADQHWQTIKKNYSEKSYLPQINFTPSAPPVKPSTGPLRTTHGRMETVIDLPGLTLKRKVIPQPNSGGGGAW